MVMMMLDHLHIKLESERRQYCVFVDSCDDDFVTQSTIDFLRKERKGNSMHVQLQTIKLVPVSFV